MDWHPLVAPVVGAIGVDGARATLPDGTIARIQTGALALDAAGRADLAVHVVALAKMIWQGRGPLDVDGIVEALAALAASLMGDAEKARDAFATAGVAPASALLGHKRDVAAPAAPKATAAAPVKATRGLKKT
jgi:hypothetical protein